MIGRAASALATKSSTRHVVAGGEAMHVAGLQRIELGKAGVKEAPGDLFGLGRPSQVPSWPSRRAGGSAASRNASTRWSEMRMWLDELQSVPGRHRIDFQHEEPPVTGLDDVDPGIIGADAIGRANREIDQLLAGDRRLGAGALLDIGDPARSVPDHGGDDAALAYEQPPVLMVRLRRLDELLEIIGPIHLLGRGEIGERADQAQALALRPEQRLLHELPSLGEQRCGDLLRRGAADAGEGARRRDPRALQEERRGRFIDATLDGAGIVPHRHAELAQARAARRDRA